jgi:hypothetical protein
MTRVVLGMGEKFNFDTWLGLCPPQTRPSLVERYFLSFVPRALCQEVKTNSYF